MWHYRIWIIAVIGLFTVQVVYGQGKANKTPADDPQIESENATTTTKSPLTGDPQKDYIHDPNLPHELKGYDLSNYPFYARLPEDLLHSNFTCDDRHDGFYASIPHHCQVYHNCLFGTRYDFLCANFTVFDQKNFICHYVSEVDCPNSELHYDRNDELYETTTTTTQRPFIPANPYRRPRPGAVRPFKPRTRPQRPAIRPANRRTTTTEAPAYEDYYSEYDYNYPDYYNYYDFNYYDYEEPTTTTTTTQKPRRPVRPRRPGARPGGRFGNLSNDKDNARSEGKPRRPVDTEEPIERPRSSRLQQSKPRDQFLNDTPIEEPPQDIAESQPRRPPLKRRPGPKLRAGGRPKKTTTTTTEATSEYYDYEYDYYADEETSSSTKTSTSTTTTTTPAPARANPISRNRPGPSVRRPGRPRKTTTPPSTTTTTTTTTEAPRRQVNRRPTATRTVAIRKNPVSLRKAPIEGAEPFDLKETEPLQDSQPEQSQTISRQQRPQRLRPQPVRRISQDEEASVFPEGGDVIVEPPPLAPGVEIRRNERPTQSKPPRRTIQRVPIRRRPGSRVTTPKPVPFDYYEY